MEILGVKHTSFEFHLSKLSETDMRMLASGLRKYHEYLHEGADAPRSKSIELAEQIEAAVRREREK